MLPDGKPTLCEALSLARWVSILGSNEGQKIESSKNAAGERTYKIVK
jgi:hypothetical protein